MSDLLLHIEHASLRFNIPRNQGRAALLAIFGRGPDVVGFTEAAPAGTKWQLRKDVIDVGRSCGYTIHGGVGDTCVAVADNHKLRDFGSIFVNPADHRPASQGGHGPRFVDWVEFDFFGNTVTYSEAHWLTKFASRPKGHIAMTEAMIGNVQDSGKGNHLAFFGGDTNINEKADAGQDPRKPDVLFGEAGLTTIWDEVGFETRHGKIVNTHGDVLGPAGSVIDVIGSYDKDTRVKAHEVRVWPRLDGLDHAQISAWYNVKRLARKR